MYFATEQQHDRLQLYNLALVQKDETSQERMDKANRMREIFSRSQIGTTIVASGEVLEAEEAGEPSAFATQKVTVMAAGEHGLVIKDQLGEVTALGYQTLRLPIISYIEKVKN